MFCCCRQGANPDRRDFPLSNGYQAINLPATGLFNRVLDKENLDENLSACRKRGIQYKSQVRLSMRVSICIYIFLNIF